MKVIGNYSLIVTLTFLFLYHGCISDKHDGSINQKTREAIKKIVDVPTSLSLAAVSYRATCGKWPHSLREIVQFSLDCNEIPFDPNLIEAEKSLRFEELPDGKLKIISSDSSFSFSLTLDVTDINNTPSSDIVPCCGKQNDSRPN